MNNKFIVMPLQRKVEIWNHVTVGSVLDDFSNWSHILLLTAIVILLHGNIRFLRKLKKPKLAVIKHLYDPCIMQNNEVTGMENCPPTLQHQCLNCQDKQSLFSWLRISCCSLTASYVCMMHVARAAGLNWWLFDISQPERAAPQS